MERTSCGTDIRSRAVGGRVGRRDGDFRAAGRRRRPAARSARDVFGRAGGVARVEEEEREAVDRRSERAWPG